jgi:hypothetical protein
MTTQTDGFGTIVQNLGGDGSQANWYHAEGNVQLAPFLNVGSRVIWQSHSSFGGAIQDAGADRFGLHGGSAGDRHFRLVGSVGITDGVLSYQWYNDTDSLTFGRLATTATGSTSREAIAYITVPAGQVKVVELRFLYADSVTFIGQNGVAGFIKPSAFLETLG